MPTATSHPPVHRAGCPVIAIISQKGPAGKTTLALHLAAAAHDSGRVALVVETDSQATASQWAAWRADAPPEVIDSPPSRLATKIASPRAPRPRSPA